MKIVQFIYSICKCEGEEKNLCQHIAAHNQIFIAAMVRRIDFGY